MLKLVYVLIVTFVTSAALYGGSASACSTCGCQDAAAKPACESCPAGECSCGHGDAAKADCANCPNSDACACAPAGCPYSKANSHGAEELPDWHAESPEGLNVSLQEMEAFDVVYLAGTFSDDMEQLYGQLMATAGERGLINGSTHVGAVLPGVLYAEPTDETEIHVAIWNTEPGAVDAPMHSQTIPGGTYMVVEHWGSYDQIGDTYMRAISWAQENGIEFAEQPSFVHHVTDPSTAPTEQWLTEIYLPFTHSAS